MMFRNPGWVTARMQLPEIFPEIILQSRSFPGHFPGNHFTKPKFFKGHTQKTSLPTIWSSETHPTDFDLESIETLR
jgi:hypothetical protein